MRWNVGANVPPLTASGTMVLFNGAEVKGVCAFDTEEGWLDARCRSGHQGQRGLHVGHGGKLHVDAAGEAACTVRLCGKVEVIIPPRVAEVTDLDDTHRRHVPIPTAGARP